MVKLHKFGFTIVELIVVITILAILGTIGFISFSSHLTGTRDINRITQLSEIYQGLETYKIRGKLPLPDQYIEVKASGSTIGYQGNAGKNVLEKIGYSKGGIDPRDSTYFTYYVSSDKKYTQLMAYLEKEENLNLSLKLFNNAYSSDLNRRYPTLYGSKLGILTESGTNIPIQDLPNVSSSGYIDINLTNNYYKAYLTDDSTISGTGKFLYRANPRADCNRLFQSGIAKKNGEYYVTPKGQKQVVYCNLEFADKVFYDFVEDGDMENTETTNWPIGGNLSITTDDKLTGNTSLKVVGGKTIIANNYTYIQPGKSYKLNGNFKLLAGSSTGYLYFGFAEYDENFQFIANNQVHAIPGTETTLINNVNATDTKIDFYCDDNIYNSWKYKTPSNNRDIGLQRHSCIAFDVDDSGNYSDLPNRNMSNYISNQEYSSVSEFEGLLTRTSNTCTLNYHPNVGNKVGKSYPAGTKIRLHNSGGGYNYIAAGGVKEQFTWTNYNGIVQGISNYGANQNYFRRGTKFIKVLILANYWSRKVDGVRQSRQNDATLFIDDISMEVVN